MGNDQNQKSNKEQQQEINTNSKRINLSLIIAILALCISAIHLIFSSPYFMDSYNKPIIEVFERNAYLSIDSAYVIFVYEIINTSHKSAEEVFVRLICFDKDKIQFMPNNEITIVKEDEEGIPLRNHTYRIDNLVPDERYILFIYSDIEKVAEFMRSDTLQVGKEYKKPAIIMVPQLSMVKSKKGFAKINRLEYLKMSSMINLSFEEMLVKLSNLNR